MKLFAKSPLTTFSHFIIEHDERVGWYLYAYRSDRCVRDYLQDTLELAQQQGLAGVPGAEGDVENGGRAP